MDIRNERLRRTLSQSSRQNADPVDSIMFADKPMRGDPAQTRKKPERPCHKARSKDAATLSSKMIMT